MNKYWIGASMDIGNDRDSMEDAFQYIELDDNNIFAVIADGSQSAKGFLKPASIVINEICIHIQEAFEQNKRLFLVKPDFFIRYAMFTANRILGSFKIANEELFSGYSASVTCCLITEKNEVFIVHAGNTRAFLLRDGELSQVTTDHTVAADLLREGKIDLDMYYSHPARLQYTSGLGMLTNPQIQSVNGTLNPSDIIILTTDGIHYAINPQAMTRIILEAEPFTSVPDTLIMAAKEEVKYPDNMAAMLIVNRKGLE